MNSLSYLAVLHSICLPNLASPREHTMDRLVEFLHCFDPRQMRYAGSYLRELLDLVASGQVLPPLIAVDALATAILRIDPTGGMLTSTHTQMAKLAYTTDTIDAAFPVIDKNIVFYPNMANWVEPDPLCDLTLSPASYIHKETGLTLNVKPAAVLEYDLLCGMMYCTKRNWAKAHAAFERVITFPTRDGGTSKIMAEAYKKWILASLLHKGKLDSPPSYTAPAALKAFGTLGKHYTDIVALFDAEGPQAAGELKQQVESLGAVWHDDGNLGLIQEVLAAYQEWQILNLQHVYSKIAISDVRELTRSAQTGSMLENDDDAEALIQNMIISGTLKGVIEKNDDDTAYLTFLPSSATFSEDEFAKQMTAAAVQIAELEPVLKATNERLGTSKEYIRHLVKEQRRSSEKNEQDPTLGFDSQVDDEDLMGGITSTA